MADKFKNLSDAIRLGSTFRPQCFGALAAAGRSCAIGAAYEAAFGTLHLDEYGNAPFGTNEAITRLSARFGITDDPCFWKQIMVVSDGGESRESIADQLERRGL